MRITNQNVVGFQGVNVDAEKLKKFGPQVAKEVIAALPEIKKKSKGLNVKITTEALYDDELHCDRLHVIKNDVFYIATETKKRVGGFLGFWGGEKGRGGAYINPEDPKSISVSDILQAAKESRKSARSSLIHRFEWKYGKKEERHSKKILDNKA